MANLPPPPVNDKPGSFAWLEWYRQLRNYVSTSGSVPWYIINFSGSNLTDIAIRLHNNLQGLQGGTAGQMNHLTDSQITALLSSADKTDLTDGGNSILHYHSIDRDRANHTGTQLANTISNFNSSVQSVSGIPNTNITGLGTASTQSGLSVTITTDKLTLGGANGSMTFTNGVLTSQTQAT